MIRTGEKELKFIGTIGKRKSSSILLTNIKLINCTNTITDHVWLSYRYCSSSVYDGYLDNYDNFKELLNLGSKENKHKYWGRHIRFSARIMTYNFSDAEYGLYFTQKSYFELLD